MSCFRLNLNKSFLAIFLFIFIFQIGPIVIGLGKKDSRTFIQKESLNSAHIPGQVIIEIEYGAALLGKKTAAEVINQLHVNTLFIAVSDKIGLLSIEPIIDYKLLAGLKNSESLKRFLVLQYNEELSLEYVQFHLSKVQEIRSVEPAISYSIQLVPNDAEYPNQDHHPQISSPEAWDIETGDSTIIIAIVDNGFDMSHIDLIDNYYINQIEKNGLIGVDDDGNGLIDDISGYDFVEDNSDPGYNTAKLSGYKHGTHVAGIAAAVGNNAIGVSGISWKSKILPIKVAKDTEPQVIPLVQGLRGITYAIAQGAHIINLSWGGVGNESRAAQEVMNLAYQESVIVVASAGNKNEEASFYPASYHHVISVAWVDGSDAKASLATYGKSVDLSAPGSSILSLFPENQFGRISGSSMSSPMVAGTAALLKSLHPQLTIEEMEKQIVFSADLIESQLTYADKLGSGRLNVLNVLTATELQQPPAKFVLHSFSLNDSLLGNDNQIIEPGETFLLKPLLSNVSLGSSPGMEISLTTDQNSIVTIENSNLQVNVLPDTEVKLLESFKIHASSEVKSEVVQFLLSFAGDNVLAETETLVVQIGKAPILVVDDDDGNINVERFYSTPLEAFKAPFVSWNHNQLGEPSGEYLKQFPMVIWLCEWAFPSLNPADRTAISEYLELGGNLFLSGQDIGWDLSDPASINATDDARNFYENVIQAQYVSDDAGDSPLGGIPFNKISNNLKFSIYQPGRSSSEQFPDVFQPTDSASVVWKYENNSGVGGLLFDGIYRLVYFGFGLEAINAKINTNPVDIEDTRFEVFERVLNFLHPLKHEPVIDRTVAPTSIPILAEFQAPGNLPDQINLLYKLPDDTLFQSVQLTEQDKSFIGELDLQNKEGLFQYYFELIDPNSQWFFPIMGQNRPFMFYVGKDTIPPAIYAEKLNNSLAKMTSYSITASISDNAGLDSANLFIYYHKSSPSVDSIQLSFDLENNHFVGKIPGSFLYGDSVTYWLTAKDKADPANQIKQDTVNFIIGLDDFESGLEQWTLNSKNWGLDQSEVFSGKYALSTSPGQDYPQNLNTVIQSRDSLDFDSLNQARLLFYSKYSIESGDAGFVEMKVGEEDWQIIAGPLSGLKNQWQLVNIDLLPFLGESECRLRFRFFSDDQTTTPLPGWFIDDVRILQDDYITGISEESIVEFNIPDKLNLWPIFPNPVRELAIIQLEISKTATISVAIYNLLGQRVREIFSGVMNSGKKELTWSNFDDTGKILPAGIYFLEVKSEYYKKSQKVIVLH